MIGQGGAYAPAGGRVQADDLQLHLSGEDAAAYLDGGVSHAERARIEAHLAECDTCRDEVVAVVRLLHRRSAPRRWMAGLGIAAAAAILLLVIVPNTPHRSVTREPPVTVAGAPRPVAPVGATPAFSNLTWTSVPRADRYRVQVFDDAGTVLWETDTPDTSATVPARVTFAPARVYYWKVEARTGFDRWAESELTRFTIRPARE
jgi:putative zinc finger protein